MGEEDQALEKPRRQGRGKKTCPSCQQEIAAATAKCPKCDMVFRTLKEKSQRSGRRGRKLCPLCAADTPSAASNCKVCGHIFRFKAPSAPRNVKKISKRPSKKGTKR
mmetsp:Transcript_2269/g.3895  ORF Transcript_2269/g.3895 Transcript_2269/m.3895 type:complete len:107 (-) Transcript_2269:270-590(-)